MQDLRSKPGNHCMPNALPHLTIRSRKLQIGTQSSHGAGRQVKKDIGKNEPESDSFCQRPAYVLSGSGCRRFPLHLGYHEALLTEVSFWSSHTARTSSYL